MSVRAKATTMRPEMFGTVVDMPTPWCYIIETHDGNKFYVHDSEIVEFFPVG